MKRQSAVAIILSALLVASLLTGCQGSQYTETFNTDTSNTSVATESSETDTVSSGEESSEDNNNAESEETSESSSEQGSSSSSTSTSNPSSSSSSGGSGVTASKPSTSTSTSKPSGSSNNSGVTTSKPSTQTQVTKPAHTHSYTAKVVKATCTSDGYTVHTCSCGNSYTDSYTEATGHKWGSWTTVKKATTSSEGRKERTCSSCGKTESKTIAKLPSSSSSTGGHAITGARKAVYSYRGMDSFSSVNLVDLINEERRKEGLCDLEWTADGLTRWVREDSNAADMYRDYFDSNGNFNPYLDPEVREPLEGAQKMADMGYATHGDGVGCSCVGSCEGAKTIEDALRQQIKAYMNSAGHRAILMNANSHSVTVAYAIDENGTVYTAIRIGGSIGWS